MSPTLTSWWWLAILVVTALAAAKTLAEERPGQNVASIVLLSSLLGAGGSWLSRQYGYPGSSVLRLGADAGPGVNLACACLGWMSLVFHCRLAAERLLKQWRQSWGYGWVLLGLSSLLAGWLDFQLRPFVLPGATKPGLNQEALLELLATCICCALSLGLSTPWLVKRRPGETAVGRQFFPVVPLAGLSLAVAHGWHGRWALAVLGVATALPFLAILWRRKRP